MAVAKILGCFEQGDPNEGWRMVRNMGGQDLNEITSFTKLNFLGGDVREQIMIDFVEDNPRDLPFDRFVMMHPLADQARSEKPFMKRILSEEPMAIAMTISSNGRSMAKSFYKKLNSVIRALELDEQLKSRCMTQMDEEVSERRLDAILGYIKFHDMERDEFIENIEKLREQQENTRDVKDGVLITSVHKAKGLEWPMVIMPSMEEGLFPFEPQEGMTPGLLESERRLCYVAMTRSQETLHLIGPDLDRQYSKLLKGESVSSTKETDSGASSFLFEMQMNPEAFKFKLHGKPQSGPVFRDNATWADFAGRDSRSINTGGL